MVRENKMADKKCPICGERCSKWSWDEHKHCSKCHKLIEQGYSWPRVRQLRVEEDKHIKLDKLPSLSVIEAKYNKKYDFNKKFPNGIFVYSDGSKHEQELLIATYENFEHYAELEEFPTLMNVVLAFVLESDRVSKLLNIPTISSKTIKEIYKILDNKNFNIIDKNKIKSLLDTSKQISAIERKNYMDIIKHAGKETSEAISTLNNIKKDRTANAHNVITEEFRNMVAYHHEHDQEYSAIGICVDCDQRIMVKTNFTTFRAVYEEYLEEIKDDLIDNQGLDKVTVMEMYNMINKKITDQSLAETYITEFVRRFEKHLL